MFPNNVSLCGQASIETQIYNSNLIKVPFDQHVLLCCLYEMFSQCYDSLDRIFKETRGKHHQVRRSLGSRTT